MVDERSSDLDVLVLHHWAALAQLMDVNERTERHPPLVGDARGDVVRVHLEEQLGHLLERRWPPRVDSGP
jgi:hypothetical protein